MKWKKYLKTTTLSMIVIWNLNLYAQNSSKAQDEKLEAYLKFTKIVSVVEEQYVDKLSTKELIDLALEGMLEKLDSHSSFINAKKYEELQQRTNSNFGGVGVDLEIKDGLLIVVAPIEGSPADRAKIRAKDIILKIDNQDTIGMNLDKATSLLRGKPQTPTTLTILRRGEFKPRTFNIMKEIIETKSVDSKIIDNDILYLRIRSFNQKVISKIRETLKKNPKTKGIIVDLRNNTGGLLNQAIGTVDIFIDHGIILTQKGQVPSENLAYNAKSSDSDSKTPLVILVNSGSASASEIVAGSLQEHKRAIVIGTKTFGMGTMQVVMPIENNESIRLTIARFYLPSGKWVQDVGITPDIIIEQKENEDTQLKTAIDELKKR